MPIKRWASSNILFLNGSLLSSHDSFPRNRNSPKRNDDELGIFGPIFDVVGDDGHITEVKGSVNLIHEVQWCWLFDR